MNYKLKDISVIIPTMNRESYVLDTLRSLPQTLKEIILVNQGPDMDLSSINMNIPIKIVRSEPPSITIARNKGLQYATGRLICYIDDDVTVSEYYFEHVLEIFNSFPDVEGVAGWRPHSVSFKSALIDCYVKWPFLLRQCGLAKLNSPYGNQYPINLWRPIQAEWFPGMNMVFKKEVFMWQRFDENLLGYTIAEDIDFTYRIFKRNPRGLIITPYAPIIHRDAKTYHQDQRKLAFINQVDHLYFAMKHNMIGKWWWNIFGISLLRTLAAPFKYEQWLYFIESLEYCFNNWSLIKQGRLREWTKQQ